MQMAQIDLVKYDLSFATRFLFIFLGIIILISGGLISMYVKSIFNGLFVVGIIMVFGLLISMIFIAKHIQKKRKILGSL
ncbi:MAG: hypothetical protein DRQ51_03365 [Gammaproteobacteria bacterium]|nr:MAG: hypothetical protein DRQ51_03365 [Gammaproteobacteria bacterium]